jgi:hypothetical protein
MGSQQEMTPQSVRDDVKRNLTIHTVVTFVLFMAPMFISYKWWPIIGPFIAGLWLFILLRVSGPQGRRGRILKLVSLAFIASSVLCGTLLALDLSIKVLERFRIYFTLFGTLIPLIMFFSLFVLFFFYKRRA